jgi:AcrR family transcriptional regulator
MKRGQKTEQKILKAALRLFLKNGYHGTSIHDITAKVGLTKGALYSHFKSKKDLVFRLFEEFEQHFVDDLIVNVNEQPGNAIEKLHRTISFISKFGLKHHELAIYYQYMANELSEDSNFKASLTRIRRKQKSFFTGLFRSGIQQGLFRSDIDPGLMASLFVSFSNGMFQHWASTRSQLDGQEFVSAFRKMFFGGVTN